MEVLFLAQNVRLLAGREHHERRHLLHMERPVRRPGPGLSFGSSSASPAADSMDFSGSTAFRKRASVRVVAKLLRVCVYMEGGPDGHQSSGERPGYRAPMSSSGVLLTSAAPSSRMLYDNVISVPASTSLRARLRHEKWCHAML